MKNERIFCLFILTWIFLAIAVIGNEQETKRIDARIDEVSENLDSFTVETVSELTEIEDRLEVIEHHLEIIDIRLSNHYQLIKEIERDVANHEEKLSKPTPTVKAKAKAGGKVRMSESEIRQVAALVYLEVGGEDSFRLKKAIASVVVNRMRRYGKTATQVIYEDGVFSPAYKVPYTTPSSSCIKAVRQVVNNGSIFPIRVTAFRNGHYHSFGRPYCRIGNVYFSSV